MPYLMHLRYLISKNKNRCKKQVHSFYTTKLLNLIDI